MEEGPETPEAVPLAQVLNANDDAHGRKGQGGSGERRNIGSGINLQQVGRFSPFGLSGPFRLFGPFGPWRRGKELPGLIMGRAIMHASTRPLKS